MTTTATDVIVTTRQGKVRGGAADGVWSFKGVPYAAPPFGSNRLLPPQPPASWNGVRDALAFGPKPPQPAFPPGFEVFMPEYVGPGEDCLTLNIWTPDPGKAGLPVMVWIPGGMFKFHATGACPWYDGSRFARDGIVCVTINYRVGAEGFLYLDKGNANRGLLDQVAALKWVHDNIAAFGGDPSLVTVFGQSAGALSIGMFLAMPCARGLFRRAILQTGAAHFVVSEAGGRRVTQQLAAKLGIDANREAFATVPVDRLLVAQEELEADLVMHRDPERWGSEAVQSLMLWQPVIDCESIPKPPIEAIAAGASSDIDLIIGTTTDEHRLFLVVGGMLEQTTDDMLARAMEVYGLPVEKALAAYRRSYPGATAGDLLAAVQTDWYWRIPALRLADAHAQGRAATYMYEFAWRSPQLNGLLGAYHGLDILFIFNAIGKSPELLLETEPPYALAEAMHASWARFALNGDPGWPKYDLSQRATMRFDTASRVVDDPRLWERQLWERIR